LARLLSAQALLEDMVERGFDASVGTQVVAKLTADMKRVVMEQRLAFVATVCPDGTPNLSPKAQLPFGTTIISSLPASALRGRSRTSIKTLRSK
jgi:hypothetical protein